MISSVTAIFSSGIEIACTPIPVVHRRMHNVRITIILRLLVLIIFFVFVFLSVL